MSRRDNHAAALDQIAAYERMLRVEVRAAVELLNWYAPDGLAASRCDGVGHTHSNDSPIERVLSKRGDYDAEGEWSPTEHIRHIAAIGDELNAAATILRNLLNDCRTTRRRLGHKVPPRDGDRTRCDGGAGREGYPIPRSEGGWSFPDCENYPDKGARTCARCRQASSRWARSQSDVTVSQTASPQRAATE